MPSSVPPPYSRQNNFVADATNNPGITVPGIAADLDAEYEAIRTSLNQTISRLSEIQRDDGKLRSGVLDPLEYDAINAAGAAGVSATASATAAAASAASASSSASSSSANAATASAAAIDALGHKNQAAASAASAAINAVDTLSYRDTAIARATAAANSATAAASSATNAALSASNSLSRSQQASASATAAAGSATQAASSATSASDSAASALDSKNTATSAATSAQTAATAASTSESNAADSAVSAANSAAISTTKAHEANMSAVAAETSAQEAADASVVANTSRNEAVAAAANAYSRWNEFDSRYLGAFATPPTVDGTGDLLTVGATYFNSTAKEMRVWDGTQWFAQYVGGNSTVSSFNNRVGAVNLLLSDVSALTTGAVSSVLTANLAASRAVVSDASGKLAASTVTAAEVGHLSGVSSPIQTQIGSLQTAVNGKEPTIAVGTTAQYWRGDKSWQDFFSDVRAATLTGLSTLTATAVAATDTVLAAIGKLQAQISANLTTLTSHTSSTSNPHSVTKAQVGLANVDNTSDANKPISAATQTALDGKAATSHLHTSANITNFTTAAAAAAPVQSVAGRTGTVTLAKADVGLGNVDNTADLDKPISTATQAALDGKLATTSNQIAKAWVNFNGTGTVAIRSSFNVSSITDNAVGDYTINFTAAMTDANYAIVVSAGATTDARSSSANAFSAPTSSASRVRTYTPTGASYADANYVMASVFR